MSGIIPVVHVPGPQYPSTIRMCRAAGADGYAKFWMEPLALDSARGLRTQELARAEALIAEHAVEIGEKWHEVFGR